MNQKISNMRHVVGLGELLWDCFPNYRRMGGAPANFAYHAAQFGHKAKVISAIGDDENGKALVKELEAHQLPYHLDCVDLPTGTVRVDTSVKNDPKYTIKTDVAWSVIPFTVELAEIARSCCAVCYGTLAQYGSVSRETIGLFLDAVPNDCYKIYDINLRDNSGEALYSIGTIKSSLSKCNVLKVNIGELDYLTKVFSLSNDEEKNVEVCSRLLMERFNNVKIIIVTMGTDGSWIFGSEESSFQPTPKVEVKDVVGAGDSFTGAFVGSLLNGKGLRDAHRIAVNVSAYVCTQPDGMPIIPENLKH